MSLEYYPNKVIETCPFNYGWIKSCYGKRAATAIGRSVVSCSGVTLGSKHSILVYVCLSYAYYNIIDNDCYICVYQSYLVMQHLDPMVRKRSVQTYWKLYGRGQLKYISGDKKIDLPPEDNDRCYSRGMDQGIHNWLLSSGVYEYVHILYLIVYNMMW